MSNELIALEEEARGLEECLSKKRNLLKSHTSDRDALKAEFEEWTCRGSYSVLKNNLSWLHQARLFMARKPVSDKIARAHAEAAANRLRSFFWEKERSMDGVQRRGESEEGGEGEGVDTVQGQHSARVCRHYQDYEVVTL
ncbi:unnamed protein product [Choristocarpus tenellus]